MPRRNKIEKHEPFRLDISNCQKKRHFKSEKEAIFAADFQMLQDMNLELSVYKCSDCNLWHLTRNIIHKD